MPSKIKRKTKVSKNSNKLTKKSTKYKSIKKKSIKKKSAKGKSAKGKSAKGKSAKGKSAKGKSVKGKSSKKKRKVNKRKKILLIVPHGICDDEGSRDIGCDRLATYGADILEKRFKKEKYSVNRLDCKSKRKEGKDCNRPAIAQQDKPFHKELIRKIKKCDMVVDVHSQPNNLPYFLSLFLPEEIPTPNKIDKKAGQINHIIKQATLLGKPSVLVEFNESHREEQPFVDKIIERVKIVISKKHKYKDIIDPANSKSWKISC
jgi:hypothetical protein